MIRNQRAILSGTTRRLYVSLSPQQSKQSQTSTLASEASNLKQQRASGKPLGMRYVGWLWDLLPRRKQSLTMREHQRELDLEPTNPAAMINDFREYQKFEGKLPIKQTAVGRTVMNMSGDTLTGQSVQLRDLLDGKQCTLLLFKFRQLGEEHLSLYRRHFMQSIVKSDDWTARGTDAGVVDVVVTENPMFRPLSWLINWGNRRQTPAEFHESTIIHYGPITEMRMRLGMHNSLVGWAYLCDQKGRIKWQANGKPTAGELHELTSAAQSLMQQSPSTIQSPKDAVSAGEEQTPLPQQERAG